MQLNSFKNLSADSLGDKTLQCLGVARLDVSWLDRVIAEGAVKERTGNQ